MEIEYHILDEPPDFERVVDLEIVIWGLNPRDSVSSYMLRAIQYGGGLVNGALIGDQLVGMGVMFPVRWRGEWVFWSHITGVHPDFQQLGIGAGLKQQQRRWVLEQGGAEIRWTFDPLQRGNANFNLHRLGASFNIYLVNFYGCMSDEINRGLASDRVEAVWRLTDPHVQELADGDVPPPPESAELPALLIRAEDGEGSAPRIVAQPDGLTPRYALQLPHDLKALTLDRRLEWRLALRESLQAAFTAGYRAGDFDLHGAAYILHKA